MQALDLICVLILSVYTFFIMGNIFILLYTRNKSVDLKNNLPPLPVSILIAARNEDKNILRCLQSISDQDFPKEMLQVIVMDDNSTDHTAAAAASFLEKNFIHYKLVSLKNNEKGKKAAILRGVENAMSPLIITRDADTTTADPYWLKSITRVFETSVCDLLLSPVLLNGTGSFLTSFQQFENLAISSLGSGMAAINLPFVCSGANLAYKKDKFIESKPYSDNITIASGDDMFLLKKFYRHKFRIRSNFSIHSMVHTPAENTLKGALDQRLRWASKSSKINIFPVFFTGILMLFTNLVCLFALVIPFINRHYLTFSLLCLTLKFIIDFLLLFLSARMFKQKVNWSWLPMAFLLNCLYVPVIIFASTFSKPNWKTRTV